MRLFAGLTVLALTNGCGDGDGTVVPPSDPPRPATVAVTPAATQLSALGATVQLSAEVRDQEGRVLAGTPVAWTSGNPLVATVDGSGLVTAADNGAATVTATAGGAAGMAEVTVKQVADSVSVGPAEATMTALGDIVRLTATAFDANGRAVKDAEFFWESSDDAVATVDGSGLVTAVDNGTATIMASTGGARGTSVVTVTVVVVPGWVVATPPRATLFVGDTVRLSAEVRDASGNAIEDAEVVWSSGTESVATVNQEGLVRAVATGEAIVMAEAEEVSDRVRVTVVEPSDRGALVSLYRSTEGASWEDRTNWLTDAPLGDWHGVTVDRTGRVVGLELDANNLVGSIPPQIALLSQLRRLTLADNALDGGIPPEIANLSLLSFLVLSGNSLSGEIPRELGKLTEMATMGMSRNRLSGRIPPEIGRLTKLGWLDLGNNDLTGEIPPALAIPGLQTLIVAGNLLRGPVPSSLIHSGLRRLKMSDPRHRNLYLCLPGTPAFVAWAAGSVGPDPQYCNDSDRATLEALYQATMGASWTNSRRWLASPALGEWFGVESDSLGRVVALDLTDNGLSGELPARLGHLPALTRLRIGSNALSGRLPTSLTTLSLRELRYSGTGLCTPAGTSFRAWLNTITVHEGTGVECASTSDRDILVILYRATGGPNWTIRTNWLTDLPLGEWHGVDVDAEGHVIRLHLMENNLNGVIPPELGRLSHLEDLQLYGNPLTGPIPSELGNLSRLRKLDLFFTQLGGTIPPELGNLQALEELWLERVPLTGSIPPELCYFL